MLDKKKKGKEAGDKIFTFLYSLFFFFFFKFFFCSGYDSVGVCVYDGGSGYDVVGGCVYDGNSAYDDVGGCGFFLLLLLLLLLRSSCRLVVGSLLDASMKSVVQVSSCLVLYNFWARVPWIFSLFHTFTKVQFILSNAVI